MPNRILEAMDRHKVTRHIACYQPPSLLSKSVLFRGLHLRGYTWELGKIAGFFLAP